MNRINLNNVALNCVSLNGITLNGSGIQEQNMPISGLFILNDSILDGSDVLG